MRELIVKIPVLIIADLDHPVFHTKRIAKVYAGIVMMNFYDPVVEIATVEKFYPFVLRFNLLLCAAGCDDKNYEDAVKVVLHGRLVWRYGLVMHNPFSLRG
jgi:hypothetical protein